MDRFELRLTAWLVGQYSVTARATIVVTAALSVVACALFLLYNSVMLTVIKRRHAKETKALESIMGYGDDGRVGGEDGVTKAV
jgi:hypothetical protein